MENNIIRLILKAKEECWKKYLKHPEFVILGKKEIKDLEIFYDDFFEMSKQCNIICSKTDKIKNKVHNEFLEKLKTDGAIKENMESVCGLVIIRDDRESILSVVVDYPLIIKINTISTF
jgi:GTP-binding protein EngB required for normal cell division